LFVSLDENPLKKNNKNKAEKKQKTNKNKKQNQQKEIVHKNYYHAQKKTATIMNW
jgi:hypothetical protein